ncbi:MAG: TlyA family RNA methyltransferase [Brevinematia bacterium]
MKKERLDIEMVKRSIVSSREKARSLVMAGMVMVNGQKIFKPSHKVSYQDVIELVEKPKYVSRGGFKLEGAIEGFNLDVCDKVCLDVGASTGGFTDCLIQKGARLVYSIDVGYGQIDYSLRNNPKVVVYEKINARYIDKFVDEGKVRFEEKIEIVVVDVSFISLTKIILPVSRVVSSDAKFLVLVKPQFEVEPKYVGKGGIVREEYQQIAVEKIKNFVAENGFKVEGVLPSKIKGMDGNQEYFLYFYKSNV